MDSADRGKIRWATDDEVRAAIENLTDEEIGRLRRAAEAFLYGSEFTDPLELVNEAIARAMRGARGGEGRHWPVHVPFTAFLIMTMSSIADASIESSAQARTDYLDDLVPEGMNPGDFAIAPLRIPSTEAEVLAEEECAAENAHAAKALTAVEEHFTDDEEVLMIILCLRDGVRPREIQEKAGMTLTQYNTARRRLSRGLAKLGYRGPKP